MFINYDTMFKLYNILKDLKPHGMQSYNVIAQSALSASSSLILILKKSMHHKHNGTENFM